ncbi:hypothetical protein EV421DRAFT_1900504 [Armillaria borealis]|uniref:Uncharacterized protein n=1 Tax=Armillaria borealis TaxID=47425 RepID=A0AA39JU37_9AGAR|nr:hypothetical protein EV421DRAFT_1900504 [Armillaria borealis]
MAIVPVLRDSSFFACISASISLIAIVLYRGDLVMDSPALMSIDIEERGRQHTKTAIIVLETTSSGKCLKNLAMARNSLLWNYHHALPPRRNLMAGDLLALIPLMRAQNSACDLGWRINALILLHLLGFVNIWRFHRENRTKSSLYAGEAVH